jgi:hypothetical protein
MHRLIAEKVLADPTLLGKARENVRRWWNKEGSARSPVSGQPPSESRSLLGAGVRTPVSSLGGGPEAVAQLAMTIPPGREML